ncbi:carbohydrate ABC transporter substrate-binding protein [Treponema sp. OMZ 840]|uniref:ABC transporter substrate-binding protein n=1 Tax=Treponema sp. OMZ 840 TaxID=244313 RepID=UPI003D8A84E3
MKKIAISVLAVFMVAALLPVFAGGSKDAADGEKVTLIMGSWRTDDVVQITALLKEYKKVKPNVTIEFKPTINVDYNATLRLQLESGTGPDLMYARSYATGAKLFTDGYFADVTDIPGLKENFTAGNRAPWTAPNGKAFAVPFNAIVQVVYYNKDIFKKAGVAIPQTWEDFLKACDSLKKAGITPLSNGLADEWDINECFMMGILPGFVGGAEGRAAYEKGKVPLNDAKMVAAFQAMADVAKYCPEGFSALTYNDSIALFATGKAAMWVDGSWNAGAFKDVPFNWGTFALPAPAGKKAAICFHPDTGMAYNKATKHEKECKEFLAWLCTIEGATVSAKFMPTGFFPMINASIKIENAHANEILALTQGKLQDARFVWERFMDEQPSGYVLMNQGVISVMKGEKTAKQAADELAAGVAKWYKP